MKTCIGCGHKKEPQEFRKRSRSSDGLSSRCKPCLRQAYKKQRGIPENEELPSSTITKYPGTTALQRRICSNAKQRSIQDKLPFNLTPYDIIIPTCCPILGIPLVVGGKDRNNSPSIDRILPEYGYVKGNVWIISNRANMIKSSACNTEIALVAAATNFIMKEAWRRLKVNTPKKEAYIDEFLNEVWTPAHVVCTTKELYMDEHRTELIKQIFGETE